MIRTFIESYAFAKRIDRESPETLREIQSELLRNPESGNLIQGTGGLRKLRVRDESRGKGKRGGFRVIYFDFPNLERTYLLALYDKGSKDDISAEEKKTLRALSALLKSEVE